MSSLWETMKKEYVYGGMTYRELAERYGVPESTVGKHARADLWRELRRERRLQLPLCAEEGEAVADTASPRRDERSESADPAQPCSSVIANRCSHRCGNPASSSDTQEANERTGDADCHDNAAALSRNDSGEDFPAMTETGDAAMREEVLRLAMRMAQLGCDAAQDKKQFMRYIVSEKSGKGETETAERVFRKLDTKAYRELTAAIKDLWSIAQGGEAERAGITVVLGSAEDSAV